MKKLVLILTLAAFACSPLLVSDAQAAGKQTTKHHKKHHHKHSGKKHK